MSVLASKSAGLLFMSKPYGILPPSSPTRRGLGNLAASGTAASSVGAGKHLRPRATPVMAGPVSPIADTPTKPQPFLYFFGFSAENLITTPSPLSNSHLPTSI